MCCVLRVLQLPGRTSPTRAALRPFSVPCVRIVHRDDVLRQRYILYYMSTVPGYKPWGPADQLRAPGSNSEVEGRHFYPTTLAPKPHVSKEPTACPPPAQVRVRAKATRSPHIDSPGGSCGPSLSTSLSPIPTPTLTPKHQYK